MAKNITKKQIKKVQELIRNYYKLPYKPGDILGYIPYYGDIMNTGIYVGMHITDDDINKIEKNTYGTGDANTVLILDTESFELRYTRPSSVFILDTDAYNNAKLLSDYHKNKRELEHELHNYKYYLENCNKLGLIPDKKVTKESNRITKEIEKINSILTSK